MQDELRIELGKDAKGNDGVNFTLGAHTVGFDADTLSKMIGTLSTLRANMQPAISWVKPNLGHRIEALEDPNWYLQHAPDADVILLSLQHPGLGELHFAFPRKSYLALQKKLAEQIAWTPDAVQGAD